MAGAFRRDHQAFGCLAVAHPIGRAEHVALIAVAVTREQEKASPLSGSWDGPADAFNRMNVSVQVVPAP